MNRKISLVLLLLAVIALAGVPQASAISDYKTWFETNYSSAVNSKIDACLLCHVNADPFTGSARNPYGTDFGNNGHSFTAIELLDSDGDGFSNIDEIHNLTFPGNSSDFPPTVAPPTPAATFNISGFKINNATGSGIQDWNITVTNATMQKSMLTGADGSYRFTDLINGSYNVSEEMKSGFTPVGETLQSVTIAGQDAKNVNFTNNPISEPIPANRTFAADLTGSEEVPPVVTLARANATFNLSDDGTVLQFKVTVANITNATLSHIHLAPAGVNGPIVVNLFTGPTKTGRFDGVLAEGSIAQADLIGPLAGQSLSALLDNMTNGNTYVNVHTTQHPAGEIRGQIRVAPAPNARFSISGFKINNATNSGIQDWNITLSNGTTNALIDSKPTDANGFYQFIVLANGSYNVSEEMKSGFTPVGETLQSVTIAGQDAKNVNFTNTPAVVVPVPAFNISGFKVNNATGSGVQGWNITLKNTTMQTSMLTGADGSYKFMNLVNGTYNVTEELQAGWTNVSPMSQQVTINGADMKNINFTNQPPPGVTPQIFNISGFKVNDTDGNNIWEPGEMGIENWNIMLLNATTGTQIASTSTDSKGFYEFMNLAPGVYNVTEEMKPGFTPSGATFKVVTIENMDVTDVDFLNHVTVPAVTNIISGFKINDLNGNGKQDAGENGLPGWNIRLIGIVPETAGINMETTTDDNGFYSFENLPAGMYLVVETVKGDYVPSGSPVLVVNLENGMNSMNNNFTNRPISSLIPFVPATGGGG